MCNTKLYQSILCIILLSLTLLKLLVKTGMFFSKKYTVWVTHRSQKHIKYMDFSYLKLMTFILNELEFQMTLTFEQV